MCRICIDMKKIIFALVITSLFCSCSSSLLVKFGEEGIIGFEYSALCGKELTATISSISGGGEGQPVFETERIKEALEKAKFSKIKVSSPEKNMLTLSAELSRNAETPVAKSQIFEELRQSKGLSLTLTAESLQSLYSVLPDEFQSYMDLFMAPSFTGEIMSDSEYLDLVAAVYGKPLAAELENAVLTVTLQNGAEKRRQKIRLIQLLNMKESEILRLQTK